MVPLLTLILARESYGACTPDEETEVQKRFTDCETSYRNEHFTAKSSIHRDSDLLTATCVLASHVVDTCGKHWEECYGQEGIRKMKDMHIESLIEEHGDVDIYQCDVVREYM